LNQTLVRQCDVRWNQIEASTELMMQNWLNYRDEEIQIVDDP